MQELGHVQVCDHYIHQYSVDLYSDCIHRVCVQYTREKHSRTPHQVPDRHSRHLHPEYDRTSNEATGKGNVNKMARCHAVTTMTILSNESLVLAPHFSNPANRPAKLFCMASTSVCLCSPRACAARRPVSTIQHRKKKSSLL